MNYIKLKKKLLNLIIEVDRLDKDQILINKIQVKKNLFQYVVFFEEFEQKRENYKIRFKDIKSECKTILEYLDFLENIIKT